MGSIPSVGTKIPHTSQCCKKSNNNNSGKLGSRFGPEHAQITLEAKRRCLSQVPIVPTEILLFLIEYNPADFCDGFACAWLKKEKCYMTNSLVLWKNILGFVRWRTDLFLTLQHSLPIDFLRLLAIPVAQNQCCFCREVPPGPGCLTLCFQKPCTWSQSTRLFSWHFQLLETPPFLSNGPFSTSFQHLTSITMLPTTNWSCLPPTKTLEITLAQPEYSRIISPSQKS